jgi:acetylornithine deacetylase
VRGLELGLTCFGSPTTSNQAISPFPTLKIGPGDSARSHTANEYIELQEIEQGAEIYFSLLNNLSI